MRLGYDEPLTSWMHQLTALGLPGVILRFCLPYRTRQRPDISQAAHRPMPEALGARRQLDACGNLPASRQCCVGAVMRVSR